MPRFRHPYREEPWTPARPDCPRCGGSAKLAAHAIGKNQTWACAACGGLWLSAGEFNRLYQDLDRRADVLRAGAAPESGFDQQPRYLPCPTCGSLLERRNFGRNSGVVVDSCRRHGVWFDRGELYRIVQFCESVLGPTIEPRDGDVTATSLAMELGLPRAQATSAQTDGSPPDDAG